MTNIEPQDWLAAARQLHQTFAPGDYGELARLLKQLDGVNYFLEAQTTIATDPKLLAAELESNREVLLGLANRILHDHLQGQNHLWAMIALTHLAQGDAERAQVALGVARVIEGGPPGCEALIGVFGMNFGEGIEDWRKFTVDYLKGFAHASDEGRTDDDWEDRYDA